MRPRPKPRAVCPRRASGATPPAVAMSWLRCSSPQGLRAAGSRLDPVLRHEEPEGEAGIGAVAPEPALDHGVARDLLPACRARVGRPGPRVQDQPRVPA